MKVIYESEVKPNAARGAVRIASVEALSAELNANGVVVLPSIISDEQLREMQHAFAARLQYVRWNNFDGYQRTELYRLMIEDVLLLSQGFVDLAVHPLVKAILSRYLGHSYQLTEAKGWRSLPTSYDFHGWHGDTWYQQSEGVPIHREIKLAMYLTDVRSGAFKFIKSTHRKQHPRNLKRAELESLPMSDLVELKAPAGTVFMFDTSIVHRQSIPMLEPRHAVFYAYHDPGVTLQKDDVAYYRYHPLLLNAAFLGDLSEEDQRILGFGDKRNYQPAFVRNGKASTLQRMIATVNAVDLRMRHLRERISALLRRFVPLNGN
jgi:ectoine hydroxylase-related dioxygenase (phytanoyl-CoA dioxygenase family)